MIRVSIMYPNQPDAHFDFEYYIGKHIPLVQERWGPLGMRAASVDRGLAGGAPGVAAPYLCVAHLSFESVEDFQQAMAREGAAIMADVPNYTTLQAAVQISEILV